MKPDYEKNGVTLYCADCRDVLPTLGKVDAVVTDPPYGVGFQYESYIDTENNWDSVILPRLKDAIDFAPNAAVCMSMRQLWKLPQALWIVCWLKRGSVRHMRGGNFSEWEPVFIYGAANFPSDVIDLPDCINHVVDVVDGHPCPKPERLMRRIIEGLGPSRSQTILDPFMGSGTTGVACVRLGRKFIGIEIEPKYFDIAVRRIEAAFDETSLLDHAAKQEQLELHAAHAAQGGGNG